MAYLDHCLQQGFCIMFKVFKSIAVRDFLSFSKTWHVLLLIVTLTVGVFLTVYVVQNEDAEMRDNLVTYANTIESSIDWRPFQNILNTDPNQLKPSDLKELNTQLNDACRANRDCHFIYVLYLDNNQVKFLLDASPQPPSEISQLWEVFVEATDALKHSLDKQSSLVEGPVTDHWGTWVSARVPVKITVNTKHFVQLSVDVAVHGWEMRLFKKALVPIAFTFVFLGILIWFVRQNKQREQLLAQLFTSTTALEVMANNDDLTGLPNRRLLEDRIVQSLKAARRGNHMAAVLFLDLDFFKVVNDTHGHPVGDELLKIVAKRLIHLIRVEDTVARIGGDEFVILLPNLHDQSQVELIAEKVIAELVKPFEVNALTLQIGVSVGIAMYPDYDSNETNLIKHADSAMYAAKRQGRNCYAFYKDTLSTLAD